MQTNSQDTQDQSAEAPRGSEGARPPAEPLRNVGRQAASFRQEKARSANEEVETGWGNGRPEPRRPYGAPDTQPTLSVGRITNMPNMAFVQFQVESPEGVESGSFMVNIAAPLMIRRIPSRSHLTLIIVSRQDEVAAIQATKEAGAELHGKLMRELDDLRLQLLDEYQRNPPQRRLPHSPNRAGGRPSTQGQAGRKSLPSGQGGRSSPSEARSFDRNRMGQSAGKRKASRANDSQQEPTTSTKPQRLLLGLGIAVGVLTVVSAAFAYLAVTSRDDATPPPATPQSVMPAENAPSEMGSNRNEEAPSDRSDSRSSDVDQEPWTPK